MSKMTFTISFYVNSWSCELLSLIQEELKAEEENTLRSILEENIDIV